MWRLLFSLLYQNIQYSITVFLSGTGIVVIGIYQYEIEKSIGFFQRLTFLPAVDCVTFPPNKAGIVSCAHNITHTDLNLSVEPVVRQVRLVFAFKKQKTKAAAFAPRPSQVLHIKYIDSVFGYFLNEDEY